MTLDTRTILGTHNMILETLDMILETLDSTPGLIPGLILGTLDMILDSIPGISDMIRGTLGINLMIPDTLKTICLVR
jgi:hypothetical protein